MRIIEGNLVSKGYRFSIVVSRFNEIISGKLLEGALDCLRRSEVREEDIAVIWVPGAFEIPMVAQIAANEEAQDDTELIAVIAAAIAASEGASSSDGYVVRSIRRRY